MRDAEFEHSQSLANHLRKLRMERGHTLEALAGVSGISRATISRIENGDVSPTAETLGRLATAFALPISQLLAPMEQRFVPLLRHVEQSVWTDRQHDFTRRAVSPPGPPLQIEMIECVIGANQKIAYEHPALPSQEHHLLLLSGALWLTVDGIRYSLNSGDCLRYRLSGASLFETGDAPAKYIIALSSGVSGA